MLTSMSSNRICQCDFWIKLAHLLDDFARLQSQLICGRNAQTLDDRHRDLTTFTEHHTSCSNENELLWLCELMQKDIEQI